MIKTMQSDTTTDTSRTLAQTITTGDRSHYGDVVMGAVASLITSLKIVYSIVYSGADQRLISAPRHWPLCGEFTGDRWIPRTNGQ